MIDTLKEVREALQYAWGCIENISPEEEAKIDPALTKLDALIAQAEKAEPVVQPLPGADWTITMRRMMNAGCSKRKCTCKPEDAKNCLWWDEMGDAPHQPAPSTSPLTDKEIAAAWLSIKDPVGLGSQFIGKNGEAVRDFVRAIEAAHGIGAKP